MGICLESISKWRIYMRHNQEVKFEKPIGLDNFLPFNFILTFLTSNPPIWTFWLMPSTSCLQPSPPFYESPSAAYICSNLINNYFYLVFCLFWKKSTQNVEVRSILFQGHLQVLDFLFSPVLGFLLHFWVHSMAAWIAWYWIGLA